jgi:hypothetical protein
MIRVTIEAKEPGTSRRFLVTAQSIERALELAGKDRPGRKVRVVFPIDPDLFFAGGGVPEVVEPVAAELAA